MPLWLFYFIYKNVKLLTSLVRLINDIEKQVVCSMQWLPKTKLGKVNFVLFFLVIIGCGALFLLWQHNKTSYDSVDAAQDAVKDPKVTTKESPFKGISYVEERSKTYHYTLTYPKTGIKAVDDAIKKSIYAKRDAFLASNATRFHATVSATTSGHYISFLIKNDVFLPTNQAKSSVQTFTYNRQDKKLVTLKQFIKTEARLNRLSKEIRTEIQRQNDHLQWSAKKIDHLTQDTWETFADFGLDGKNFTVYYEPHTLANHLSVISIPITAIDKKRDTTVFRLNTHDKKYVALTFDDGPNKTVTPRILETLKKHDVKATFFMLGSSVEEAPELAKAVLKEGHEIGNHSYGHENLSKMTGVEAEANINKANQLIKDATGHEPLTIRPPYGARNAELEQLSAQPMILWGVDTLDWKTRNAASTLKEVQQHVYPGAIVLMHDIHPTTADALDAVLTYLQQQGYTCVTVSQLEGLQ